MASFPETSTIYDWLQRMTALEHNYPALRTGTHREMWKDETVYAFSRRIDSTTDEVITTVTDSWDTQTRTIPLRAESAIPVGAVLTNLMNTSDTVTVASGGVTGKQITVSLDGHEAKIYAPGTPFSTYAPRAREVTRIRVRHNAGFGNFIAIRGDTYPLTWTFGRGARNLGPELWEYDFDRIPAGQLFEFKPLINDARFSTGANYTGTGGDTIDITPGF